MSTDKGVSTVGELVSAGIIERPLDGNHGELHPKSADFVPIGVPFIMASDLLNGQINYSSCMHITPEQAMSLRKGFAKSGDVLLSHKGTLGRTALIAQTPGDYVVLTPQVTYYRVKNPEVLNNRYLKYYFDSRDFQNALNARSAGSTRPYVGITEQLSLPVVVPSMSEQLDIVSVLGAIDDKLTWNRKICDLLEAQSSTIFESLFDIDQIGGGVPISRLIDVNPSRPLRSGTESTYIGMADLPTDSALIETWATRSFTSGQRFSNGDVLLARITPCLENGKTAVVDMLRDGEVASGSTEFIVLSPKPPFSTAWVYCLARSDLFRNFAIRNMTGTSGRQRFPAPALDMYAIKAPDDTAMEKFNAFAVPAFAKMAQARDENRDLLELRDELLPNMLSGRLRAGHYVPYEAEAQT